MARNIKTAAKKTAAKKTAAKKPTVRKPPREAPRGLPGERSQQAQLARMLRVNHAGEYGAKRIYAGQMAVLGDSDIGAEIAHMAEQEQVHLETFERLLRQERVRPTLLQPLWHVAGFALGAATALLGKKAAMACTVAVEEVIDAHYAQQIEQLKTTQPELRKLLIRFRKEELEHRDIGLDYGANNLPYYNLLRALIHAGSKAAIRLSERI